MDVNDLAQALFISAFSGPDSRAKTPEHIARESFDRAAVFIAVAGERAPVKTTTKGPRNAAAKVQSSSNKRASS